MYGLSEFYQFPIIVEQDEDGIYLVTRPSLQSCHAEGRTVKEALNNMEEVIGLALEDNEYMPENTFIGLREISIKKTLT